MEGCTEMAETPHPQLFGTRTEGGIGGNGEYWEGIQVIWKWEKEVSQGVSIGGRGYSSRSLGARGG